MKYTVFVGYRYERKWYLLTPEARREFHAEHIAPIVAKYAGRADVRFFGTSGLGTRFSNFLLVEATDLKHYYFLIEELRDSALLAQNLAVITKIFVGIEDGYSEFESETAAATSLLEEVGT